jgi:hypothetical protein
MVRGSISAITSPFLAFLEVQLHQLPTHLRAHGHRVARLHGAQRGQVDRHILADHGNDRDRYRRLVLALPLAVGLCTGGGRRIGSLGPVVASDEEARDQHDDNDGQRDFPETRHETLPGG